MIHIKKLTGFCVCFFLCLTLVVEPLCAQDTVHTKPMVWKKALSWVESRFSFLKKDSHEEPADLLSSKQVLWQEALASGRTSLDYAPFLPYSNSYRFVGQGNAYAEGGGFALEEEGEALLALEGEEVSEKSYARASFLLSDAWMNDYHEVKHSRKTNPYTLKWKDFKDTVRLVLSLPDKAMPWTPPLDRLVVTSNFGLRRYRWHYGIDFRLTRRDSVRNVSYGVVRLSQYQRRGFGHYVVVYHTNGLETLYAHLSKRLVKKGDIVRSGDVIGMGGNTGRSTGPHLHFEIRYKGLPIEPSRIIEVPSGRLRGSEYVLTPSDFAYFKKATGILVHRVRRGETLSHISHRYGVSIRKLCRLNRIKRKGIIRIGQKIRVR